MSRPAFIAVDWGTSNRRAFLIGQDGTVLATERDDHGILRTARDAFAGEVAGIRQRLGDHPMLCAGMVGSTRGWVDVPYRPCPAGIDDLARALVWVEPGRTAIVPGLSTDEGGRGDVMRGEEVQLLGAAAAGLAPPDALLCQPGTHAKWARLEDGRVVRFRTALTGEVFALLRDHSLLGDYLQAPVEAGAAFAEGVELAGEGRLLTALFGERAGVVLGRRPADAVASRVSGLLIGTDVREQAIPAGQRVFILADPLLGALYAAAVAAVGGEPVPVDSHLAFVAGANAVWSLAHDRR